MLRTLRRHLEVSNADVSCYLQLGVTREMQWISRGLFLPGTGLSRAFVDCFEVFELSLIFIAPTNILFVFVGACIVCDEQIVCFCLAGICSILFC